jgi:hypothetical protein
MGATVTTGKEICAIRDPDTGEPIYLMFEECYDKRTYPHTPQWACYCIGSIKDVMQRVFLSASSCEGGMLQNRSGQITPEGYIQGWMKALAETRAYPRVTVEISAGQGYQFLLSADEIAGLKRALAENVRIPAKTNARAIAILNAVEQSNDRNTDVGLHDNIGAIAAILAAANRTPWRLVKRFRDLDVDASLAYMPTKAANFDIETPMAARIDNDNRLLMDKDGLWRHAGWEYSVVGSYVANLWEAELAEPGSYRKRIKTYREAIHDAPMADFPLLVRLDSSNMLRLDRWAISSVADFMSNTLARAENDGNSFVVPESELDTALRMPREALVWELSRQAA